MTDAKNKIAIVTGAGTGVGRAASLALMNTGFTVVLAGRRLEKLEETAKLGVPGKSLAVPSDMADAGSIAALSFAAAPIAAVVSASKQPTQSGLASPAPGRFASDRATRQQFASGQPRLPNSQQHRLPPQSSKKTASRGRFIRSSRIS